MGKELLEQVRRAGVVGAGGAGFPTHVKLDAQADTVVVNGAECEPLLRVDQQLMAARAAELLSTLQTVVDQVGAKEGIVALKGKYHDAVDALRAALPAYPKLRLHELDNFYPAGDEQVTVYEVTGRIVPEGGIPLHVGVVVTNVETLLNIRAAAEGRPVTHSYVTITGAVKQPKTLLLPVGITVGQAINSAGGAACSPFRVINGGPMMGALVKSTDLISKTTKGLIVLPEGHSLVAQLEKDLGQILKEASTACMQCSLCSEVCPRNMLGHRLKPHMLMRLAGYKSTLDEENTPMSAWLCCGCRLCEYACVMDLQPWKLNGNLKGVLGKQGLRNNMNAQPENVAKFREFKKYPIGKLMRQLALTDYDRPAPLEDGAPVFDRVCIPLKQHVGAPAQPAVQVGDRVEAGALVGAIPEGQLGANVHASISGIVKEIGPGGIVIEGN